MQMKIAISIIGIIFFWVIISTFGLSAYIARDKPSTAAFTSIIPLFEVKERYTSGSVIGVEIGAPIEKMLSEIQGKYSCEIVIHSGFRYNWDIKHTKKYVIKKGKARFKCKDNGMPFILHYEVDNEKVIAARIFASMFII